MFWKKIEKDLKGEQGKSEEIASKVDLERKEKICSLLKSDCSNEEKYLKYFLLTPGMSRDFLNTLQGASELGMDADVIIELLEQPGELFNKEIIEIYVSETHKGTEYNLKKELAEELIRGEWYVSADINGKPQKFQMVPFELLNDLKDKLDNICSILADMEDEEACASLAQASPDTDEYDEKVNESIPDIDESSLIDFDDFLLGEI